MALYLPIGLLKTRSGLESENPKIKGMRGMGVGMNFDGTF